MKWLCKHKSDNGPGYSEPSFEGLVAAEDAEGTYPQGTSTQKGTDTS